MKRKLAVCMSAVMTAAALFALPASAEEPVMKEYKIGMCNYVDAPTQNQIATFIQMRLIDLGADNNVSFKVDYQNCYGDPNAVDDIVARFEEENVDLMVGISSTVAHAMEGAANSGTPVVFAAVSDPVGSGFVSSLETPGGNMTGTSNYLDAETVFRLILAQNPNTKKIGFLDDLQQEDSETALENAKAFCEANGLDMLEVTVSNAEEANMAVPFMAEQGVDAIFTPTDGTLMDVEYEIYQSFIDAGVPHYGGADGFALNGAFVGYGVDYGKLGVETGDMIVDILLNGQSPATMPVKVLNDNIATINSDTCRALGYDVDAVKAAFQPICSEIKDVVTTEDYADFSAFLGNLFFY